MARSPPSPLVFLPISTNFTSTPGIPRPPPILELSSFQCSSRLSRGLSHQTWTATYTPFTPNNSEQRLHPPYYRGCWHGVSRCFLTGYRQDWVQPQFFLPLPQCFTTLGPSSHTRRCCVRLSPIAQNSPLLPPVGVWTVSQFQCG